MKTAIGLGALALLWFFGRKKPRSEPAHPIASEPVPPGNRVVDIPATGPERPLVAVSIPGYRRAKHSEVTPAMTEMAIASLSQPVGWTFVTESGFAVGVEEHWDTKRGIHKGVSVFLPLS